MKKIYLIALGLFLSVAGLKSQSPTFQLTHYPNVNEAIQNNDVFYFITNPGENTEFDVQIKNISSTTQTFKIRKNIIMLHSVSTQDEAQAYFCTGTTCYIPSVGSATVTLEPNETILLLIDLTEASTKGETVTNYEVSNNANASEKISFTQKYNDPTNPVSVRSNPALFSHVSGVYPNPSSSKSFLNFTSAYGIDGLNLRVLNSLGSVVLSKKVDIISGKNTVTIDSDNLTPGIYFVSLAHGSSVITRKITIIK